MAIRMILTCFILFGGWQQTKLPDPQRPGAMAPYVEKAEKEFAFYPGGKLEIRLAAPGSLKIIGWDRAAVRAEMEQIVYYLPPEQAKAHLQNYPAQVTWTQTSATVRTAGLKKPDGSLEVNVRIHVPQDRTDLVIAMIQGDLMVSGVSGWIEATLEEGNVEARDLAGYFSGVTKMGDWIVELSGPRWTGYGFTAATRKGSMNLRLPGDYSAALQLETKDGEISIDYPSQILHGETVSLQVASDKNTRSVSAPIGAGGAAIRLQTNSGNIVFQSNRLNR